MDILILIFLNIYILFCIIIKFILHLFVLFYFSTYFQFNFYNSLFVLVLQFNFYNTCYFIQKKVNNNHNELNYAFID